MRPERKPGSNDGRARVDWDEAFRYYASLPTQERGYRAVADYYQVSVRTVERHGREEGWKQRLEQIHSQAAARADAQLADARAEKLAEIEILIDASFTTYARQLQAGSVKVAPSDLLRLVKLRDDLWSQPTGSSSPLRAVGEGESVEERQLRRLEVVRALQEAGVFERLENELGPLQDDRG